MYAPASLPIAAPAALCLLSAVMLAQESSQARRTTNAPPKPSGVTPRTADGHPDLTGVWNGLGDNLNGIPNQIANNGLAIESDSVTRDLFSGQLIATFPRNTTRPQNNEQAERAAALLRRVGSNRPVYKPEHWDMVKNFDHNSNEDDPSNNCMPAGIPRGGIPSYISQHPTHLMFVYPGQGGLIATQTMYRMIPLDGRKHTPLQELDGSYTGEAIAHWDGDTLVVDSWGFNSQHLVRSDRRLLPRREHARHRALPPRGQHAHVDGDRRRPRRAARAVDDHAASGAAQSAAERAAA